MASSSAPPSRTPAKATPRRRGKRRCDPGDRAAVERDRRKQVAPREHGVGAAAEVHVTDDVKQAHQAQEEHDADRDLAPARDDQIPARHDRGPQGDEADAGQGLQEIEDDRPVAHAERGERAEVRIDVDLPIAVVRRSDLGVHHAELGEVELPQVGDELARAEPADRVLGDRAAGVRLRPRDADRDTGERDPHDSGTEPERPSPARPGAQQRDPQRDDRERGEEQPTRVHDRARAGKHGQPQHTPERRTVAHESQAHEQRARGHHHEHQVGIDDPAAEAQLGLERD